MEKLRLFTDWDYKPSSQTYPAFAVQPPWQAQFGTEADLKDKSEFKEVNRFGSLRANWHKYFELVKGPCDADFAVLPSDWKYYVREDKTQLGLDFLRKMTQLGKRVVIQYNSDDDQPLKFSGCIPNLLIVARTSFNRSKQQLNEYAMPGFVGDPREVYGSGKLKLHEKHAKPRIGFCGWAKTTPMTSKELESFCRSVDQGFSNLDLRTQADLIYSFRGTALDLLQQDESVETDFIFREGYCAGIDRDKDSSGLARVRQEFYDNINYSDYVLCVRGKGNYSYRFYETLAFGRIPIFLSTDSPLPLQDSLNWREHCVQIEHRDVKNIGRIVSDHYARIPASQFSEIQIANRSFWENNLIPERYFVSLLTKLSGKRKNDGY